MKKNTIAAINMVLNEEYDCENPLVSLLPLDLGSQVVVAEKGDTILYQKDPVRYFYFLLSGRTIILNHISWSIDDVIDFVEPLHILGLMECLMNFDSYTAFVVAETKCVMLRVPKEEFIELIQSDHVLCYKTLLLVAVMANNNMERAETHRMFPPRDILGHYLYTKAFGSLPYTYPLTRKELSATLTINLRSLYRYINDMKNKGCLSLRRGKIVIEAAHLEKLAERYSEVIL